jgi:SWI/SNF-related matrix-associated actin-dependent regulator of chromatin subfamily A member 5
MKVHDDENLSSAPEKMEEDDNDDSDVELEGVDMDEDDMNAAVDDVDANDDAAVNEREDSPDHLQHEKEDNQHEQEDSQELEEARKARMELMAEELKREREQQEAQLLKSPGGTTVDPNSKFQYLIGQSEVFAHFLAGASAASTGGAGRRKKKGGSRGKANRMTEAEEDAQLLATATSARRTVYLNQQPKILSDVCKMHKYQLEGLNWMIKLHDHGINGILADEVSITHHNIA